ncbi:LOG family protein [Zobellella maritima]|uniref:LOG family protein n=1 Tax=Zobellella maritima TaxID=2059725 RepID=UPI000E307D8F|nr:TIGR00730 family Rossman fold protein [Zobellella maritima]
MSINRVCVYCGSSLGNDPRYRQQARALGEEIGRSGLELVYGGSSVGLMGILADSALAAGGRVHGVMPESLARAEISHTRLTQLDVVADMHARKARMASLGDAFIAMPGGFGTFEELFEILTWAQLGHHNKPVGLLNVNRFFDPLLALIDHAIGQGFIKADYRGLLVVAEQPKPLLAQLDSAPRNIRPKWVK